MVAGARFCDAAIGQSLETAHRQVAGWRRRDGVPSRDFKRRTPKNLDYFAGRPLLAGLTDLGIRAARQTHSEYRALARLARHGHVAAHHAGELAGDGKAEPRPAIAARGQGIGLGEVLEQFRLLLRRHADAAISDGKLDPVAAADHPSRSQHRARARKPSPELRYLSANADGLFSEPKSTIS